MLTDFGFKQVGILFLLLAIYLRDFDVVVPCVFSGAPSRRLEQTAHSSLSLFLLLLHRRRSHPPY